MARGRKTTFVQFYFSYNFFLFSKRNYRNSFPVESQPKKKTNTRVRSDEGPHRRETLENFTRKSSKRIKPVNFVRNATSVRSRSDRNLATTWKNAPIPVGREKKNVSTISRVTARIKTGGSSLKHRAEIKHGDENTPLPRRWRRVPARFATLGHV